jgi:hypothetical protein
MKAMLDLETLSTKSNAAIVSIGAVAFDESGVTDQKFYITIDPASCEKAGMHVSASTFIWWMQQSDEARAQFKTGGVPLTEALFKFAAWCKENNIDEMWGNGADFDCVILGSAYEACDMKKPWSYSKNRCFRTLKSRISTTIANDMWTRYATGTHHNALDDAVRQAHMATDIFNMGK